MKRDFFSVKIILGFVALLFFSNCKVPYDPPVQSSNTRFLVVEGFINGNGVTSFKLSRTRNITWGDTAAYKNELNASVVVEDQNNNSYQLYEKGSGVYEANTFLNPSTNYRLHIRTSDNKEYLSAFVPFKQSPPIDKVDWNFKDGSVQINLNTHDPQNNSRYYRWDFEETWEFHSSYLTNLKYIPATDSVEFRNDEVYVCWQSQNSKNILLGSSAKLSSDVINQEPILLIPFGDKRISVLYSILVNQYVLDSSAYNYWNALKSNTENVGSIFDPQPNQTRGNIYCTTDSSETVIGYVSAGNIQQSRIFISNSQMPSDWNRIPNCTEYLVPKDSTEYYFAVGGFAPYLKDSTLSGKVNGYYSASATCVDCTLSGTNVKPSFWP